MDLFVDSMLPVVVLLPRDKQEEKLSADKQEENRQVIKVSDVSLAGFCTQGIVKASTLSSLNDDNSVRQRNVNSPPAQVPFTLVHSEGL